MDLESKRRLRTILAKWIYDETGGSSTELADIGSFAVPSDWSGDPPSKDDIDDALIWLDGERLIKAVRTMGGVSAAMLTHHGIREMERAMSAPERRTEHFVPLVNVTNIHGSMYGSQIQQGSPGATQTGTFTFDQRNNAEAFVAAARQVLDAVDGETRARASADLDTMERELKDANPRPGILSAIGREVRAALLSAGGSAAVQALSGISWP